MKHKKAEIDTLEIILILAIFTIILIFFATYIIQISKTNILDKKIESQIINKKLVSNCFSENYGEIIESKFTQETLNNCFEGINENSIFRVRLNSNTPLYIKSKKAIFEQRGQFCSSSQKSSQFCSKNVYPIILLKGENVKEIAFLTVDSIVS